MGNLRSFGLRERARTPSESCCASSLLVMEQCLGGRGFGRLLGVLGGALFLQGLAGLFGHRLPRRFVSHAGPLIMGAWLVPIPRLYSLLPGGRVRTILTYATTFLAKWCSFNRHTKQGLAVSEE